MLPIRLTVPGTLRYRAIAVRAVAEAARLVSASNPSGKDDARSDAGPLEVRDPFDTAVVSAFAEIFNNIAIHAYDRKGGGAIEIAIATTKDEIVIEVKDHGTPFDIGGVAPLPTELDSDTLPEGGMGIHIAKTMLDEMSYQPGPPNLWRLCKRLPANVVGPGRS
jgi:anti-sigma regulatory factor (Ser/Thr protein kinase)